MQRMPLQLVTHLETGIQLNITRPKMNATAVNVQATVAETTINNATIEYFPHFRDCDLLT